MLMRESDWECKRWSGINRIELGAVYKEVRVLV
jgi:hypothetical protein